MKRKVASFSVAVLGMSLCATSAFAAEQGGFLGAGVAFEPDYEGSDDQEAAFAVVGRYTYESGRFLNLAGPKSSGRAARLKVNLISESMSPVWRFGPVVQFRPERDDVDNNQVDRLKKVDSAFELGLFGGFALDRWTANLVWAQDVSDEHDGYTVNLNGGYALPVNEKLKLEFVAAATYADSDYMNTYFSVTPSNSARSGLRVYNADSGIKDAGLQLQARYRINPTWGLLGQLSYYRMLNDAKDSPLVDDVGDKNQVALAIAVTYAF